MKLIVVKRQGGIVISFKVVGWYMNIFRSNDAVLFKNKIANGNIILNIVLT